MHYMFVCPNKHLELKNLFIILKQDPLKCSHAELIESRLSMCCVQLK